MSYSDPHNIDELLEKIKTLQNVGEIFLFVANVFPTWIVGFSNHYSKDYKYLENNWKTVCSTIEIQASQILIVDDITFDDNHKFCKTICELLTRSGYSVRRSCEFFFCEKCGDTLPTLELYNTMKSKSMPMPDTWKKTCSDCI